MPRYTLPITNSPTRDGRPVTSRHIPFYVALETAADAWTIALSEFCAATLLPTDVAVVHVTSDFRHELFVGEVTVDVSLQRVGTSSITFVMELIQSGRSAGTIEFVVAQVDQSRIHAVALTPAQRAALETIPRTIPGGKAGAG